jgi:ABC-type multidrug transport system permease subunit
MTKIKCNDKKMDKLGNNLSLLLTSVLVAMFGSGAKFLSQMGRKRFSWLLFFSSVFVAAFLGLITGFICLEFKVSEYVTFAVTGIAGWTGHSFMDNLSDKVTKLIAAKIGGKVDNP